MKDTASAIGPARSGGVRGLAIVTLAALLAVAGGTAWKHFNGAGATGYFPAALQRFSLDARPQSDRYLFDYAGVLRHYEEGAHRYLKRIASRFHVESLIVSVPKLDAGHGIETLAVDIVNRWGIGADFEGRGLLLLLVEDVKQVKLAVTYQLEDVFTDSFAGYVEDLQLGPYYRANDLGTGLLAVMEELERRAQIKDQGDYTTGTIARDDQLLLAGGAGATRSLERYRQTVADAGPGGGRGAPSPEAAWETMLAQWAGNGEGIELDIYTAMTRLAMGDPNAPDPRALSWLDHWRRADYQVRSDGEHAVIWFGAIDGWENAPFLFCNTGNGWKFDIVHQRRLVMMAENPKWKVAQGAYPYVHLMDEAWQSTGKDLPLMVEDLYRCKDDSRLAARMAQLETRLRNESNDLEATIELARLNVITGRRPNHVQPLLERAKRMAPQRPEPWKYSAIYNVNVFLQYATALADIDRYISLRPDDPFGHNVKGFLLYRLGRYQASIIALEHAIEIDPDNGYAYSVMARDYALLHRRATGQRKDDYRDQALTMQRKAGNVTASDARRVQWLEAWMAK